MLNKNVGYLLTFLISFHSFAQTPNWEWVVDGGGSDKEFAVSTAPDPYGNVYVTGYFASPSITFGTKTITNTSTSGSFDIFLVKYNSNGNVIWAKGFGGSDSEYAEGVCTDALGNVYVVGEFSSNNFQIDGNVYYYYAGKDVYLAKLDSAGKYQWGAVVGGFGDDYCKSVIADTLYQNDLVYIAGYYNSDTIVFDWYSYSINKSALNDVYVACYYGGGISNYISGGGSGDDLIEAMDFDQERNLYFTGEFNSTDFSLGGKSLSSQASNDAFTIKLDYSLSPKWAKSLGGSGNDITEGISVASNGDVYISGYFSNSLTVKGQTLTSTGNRDILVVKYDSSGNEVWGKSWGSTSYDGAEAITVDSYENIYVTGYFQSTNLSFDNFSFQNQGSNDIFLVKLDENGNELWAKSTGGSSNDYAFDINSDQLGNIYVVGPYSSNSVQWDAYTIQTAGSNDAYLAKISDAVPTTVSVNVSNNHAENIYYNNITKEVSVSIVGLKKYSIELIAIMGQPICSLKGNEAMKEKDLVSYNLSNLKLSAGMYFLRLLSEKGQATKLIYWQ